jgi:hypothetical protein
LGSSARHGGGQIGSTPNRYGGVVFSQSSTRVKSCAAVLAFNWLAYSAILISSGGSALLGEINDGEFFVRQNPGSVPTLVSAESWFFSLNYSAATFGLTPLALSLLFVLSRPAWDRGVFDFAAVGIGIFILLLVLSQAAPQWSAWLAA